MAPKNGIKPLPCSIQVGEEAESATCGRHFASRYADPPMKGEPVEKRNHGLAQFVAGQYADYVGGRCINRPDGACVVPSGRRCGKFERCLLPLAIKTGGDVAMKRGNARGAKGNRLSVNPSCRREGRTS
jgi:hypothetical protein